MAAWLRTLWDAARTGDNWKTKLGHEGSYLLERMFSRVFDEEETPFPRSDRERLELVRDFVAADAEEHYFHSHNDDLDDENTEFDMYVFDKVFLAEPDALDRLPNPKRGAKRDPAEDRYLQLIERLRG